MSIKSRRTQTAPEPAERLLLGCEGLKQRNLLDYYECCERCHSPGQYVDGSLGPCCVKLPDGREAFVCCAGKRCLQERAYP